MTKHRELLLAFVLNEELKINSNNKKEIEDTVFSAKKFFHSTSIKACFMRFLFIIFSYFLSIVL